METPIHEYNEEIGVDIRRLEPEDGTYYKGVISKEIYKAHQDARWVISACNEGGFNGTEVDLEDVLIFVKNNMPELWKKVLEEQ